MDVMKIMLVFLICSQIQISRGQNSEIKPVPSEVLAMKMVKSFERFEPFTINEDVSYLNRLNQKIQEGIVLDMNTSVLNQLNAMNGAALSLVIPIDEANEIVLDLVPSDAMQEDFATGTLSGDRERREFSYEKGIFYRGMIQDDVNSLVSISLFKDKITGIVCSRAGNMNLGEYLGQHIFFSDDPQNLLSSYDFECGNSDDEDIPNSENVSTRANAEPSQNCVFIYFETAFGLYNSMQQNVPNILDDVTANLNSVLAIYANESIKVRVNEINVWTTSDPYDYTDKTTALESFSDEMELTGFNARFAHLISAETIKGGRAYVQSNWCSSSDKYRTAYSSLYLAYYEIPVNTSNVKTLAHEIGHNFGSLHTQSCTWPGGAIDNCYCVEGVCSLGPEPDASGGTIMSYCHLLSPDNDDCPALNVGGVDGTNPGINLSLGMGPLPGDKMRSNYNAMHNRVCMHGCDCPDDLYVTGVLNASSFEEAVELVYSDATLAAGNSINFDGGEEVVLIPGFDAQYGVTFEAYIDGCGHLRNLNSAVQETGNENNHGNTKMINIYPNPNNGIFTIKYEGHDLNKLPIVAISDLSGRTVNKFQMSEASSEVNLNNYPSGIYIIHSESNENSFFYKVIIK